MIGKLSKKKSEIHLLEGFRNETRRKTIHDKNESKSNQILKFSQEMNGAILMIDKSFV